MRAGACWLVGVAMFCAAAGQAVSAQFPSHSKEACSARNRKTAISVDRFTFATFANELDGETCFRVTERGHVVFQRTNDNYGGFKVGQAADREDGVAVIPNGTDITGRGSPDVVVSEWTGGAHCCRIDYVFELEPRFRLVAKLNVEDSDVAYFMKDQETGRYYYVAEDWTFAYWDGSFAGSPVHQVMLAFQDDPAGGGFHLALDKMSKPAPSAREWHNALGRVRSDLLSKKEGMWTDLRGDLWQNVVDLIYTGHSDLAWKFLREVGPRAQGGSDPTLADFCSQLRKSPYWLDLVPLLNDAPAACTQMKSPRAAPGDSG